MYFLFCRDNLFLLIYANNFEIVHTCVFLYNAHGCEVLRASQKYFTFGSHIVFFTSMISYAFLILQTGFFSHYGNKVLKLYVYACLQICVSKCNTNYYEVLSDSHKHLIAILFLSYL